MSTESEMPAGAPDTTVPATEAAVQTGATARGEAAPVAEVEVPSAAEPAGELAAEPAAVLTAEPAGARSRFGGRMTRRQALKLGAIAVPSLIGAAFVFERLTAIADQGPAPEIDPVVARYDPTAHSWGFVVDTTSCIGCGLCVQACKQENGVPLDEEHTRTWVERHTVTADEDVVVDSPDQGMLGFPPGESPEVPEGETIAASYFVPRLCMQCEEPPCVGVCPVGATYRTADGVVLVDEGRCIGCGYCVVACPYGARYVVPAGERTPTGTAGVADKCTFCYHRITRGDKPACVQVCPRGARKFGDLNDPQSEVSVILATQETQVMREELGTKPRVHYIGLEAEVAS
jgi:tetrathionate reductase subunit B